MTREEAINKWVIPSIKNTWNEKKCDEIIKALEQELCVDAINRQAAIDTIESWLSCDDYNKAERHIMRATQSMLYDLPPVNPQPKIEIGHCRDCMWWKDSDGVYRRGVGAESLCPINNREVFKGNGYCFMFDPQERSCEE